jgi:hypothetical protein
MAEKLLIHLQVNSTLSIDLGQSWTNSSVVIKTTPKSTTGAPLLSGQALWIDSIANVFVAWGGTAPFGSLPPENQAWRFTADGAGSGSWSVIDPSNSPLFSQLVRTEGCAAASGNGVGYCLGGLASVQSDPSVASIAGLPVPGLVSLGLRSGVWSNASTTGFGPQGTLSYGRGEFVPIGPRGIIVYLGGSVGTGQQLGFGSIFIYDLATATFYSQATTGDRPATRERFCTAVAAGPKGTFEIFMYGGLSSETGRTNDDTFVLSLPGFNFFRAQKGTPRGDHSCGLGRGGQVISVGGLDGFRGFPASYSDPDPWSRGIGVFDMSRMVWSDRYDSAHAPYETSSVIAQWYAAGNLDRVVWGNDALKTLFAAG